MCYTGVQLGDRGGGGGGEEGASPAFFENRERNPDFGKKDLDCVHHCKIFLVFLTKCLSSVIIPLNLP